MSNTAWANWVQTHLDARRWRVTDAARASGISHSIISRWLKGEMEPSKDGVRRMAEAFDEPILAALVVAEYLTAREANAPLPAPGDNLESVPTERLLKEVGRRLGVKVEVVSYLGSRVKAGDAPEAVINEPDEMKRGRLTRRSDS